MEFYGLLVRTSSSFINICDFHPTLCPETVILLGAPLVAQTLKNLLAMQETQVQSLGQEDPREKGIVTHSSIRAWEIPWTVGFGGL